MALEFNEFFEKYERLVADVDRIFEAVKAQCSEEVKCEKGCSDCCHALFDLSLIEAMYLNHKFNEKMEGLERQAVLDRAEEAERKQHKLVRKTFKKKEEGRSTQEVLDELAAMRLRCPLLTDEHTCELYDVRPITCRLYGIPMAFDGQTRTCGSTGFKEGEPYPTVHLEKIQDRLVEISAELTAHIQSKYSGLPTLHVPVSVALMNRYDEEYLGLVKATGVNEDALFDDEDLLADDPDELPTHADGPEECQGCSTSDCKSCPTASTGGCNGSPLIMELGGPEDE